MRVDEKLTSKESAPLPGNASSAILNPDKLNSGGSFAALEKLTENLAQSVTCPICLEYFSNAQQLQCGHIFCSECITRMLGMEHARCAVCKEKTGKRMIRNAPLEFGAIITQLRELESVVAEYNKLAPARKPASVNDGYSSATYNASRARLQFAQRMYKKPQESLSEDTAEQSNGSAYRHKRCILCPRGVDSVMFPDTVPFGRLLSAKSDKKQRELFTHEGCALYSEDVYEVEGVMQNVLRAISRAKNLVCGRDECGRSRANISCAASGCDKHYHFPCAVVEDCVLVEDGYKVFCSAHKDLAPSIAAGDFDKAMSAPTDIAAQEHEDVCYLCQVGGRLLMCDTCERVTHPVCSGLRAIPVGVWSCGVCTGEHLSAKPEKRKASKRRRVEIEDPQWNPGSGAKKKQAMKDKSTAKRARKQSDSGQKFVLANTGLNKSQKEILKEAAKKKKSAIRADVDKRVTHMVIGAHTKDVAPLRTMKLCKAIASKVPLICWKWVEESTGRQTWGSVEPHIHPLTWPSTRAPVFDSMCFYFGLYNGTKDMQEDIKALVVLGGGSVTSQQPVTGMPKTTEVLCVRDGNGNEKSESYEAPAGVKVVSTAWILDRCTKNRNFPS